eukprot:TRINITY_DN13269_c0_g1_i3.p2 TRINITY_DN13269_c0_g1~~TRINITY_DN13269_c0_g1_i3.p2  ORF type:complete len:100 (-),score=24.86 TRINITY_DN13269_c0_g1_i3:103-402(-)
MISIKAPIQFSFLETSKHIEESLADQTNLIVNTSKTTKNIQAVNKKRGNSIEKNKLGVLYKQYANVNQREGENQRSATQPWKCVKELQRNSLSKTNIFN